MVCITSSEHIVLKPIILFLQTQNVELKNTTQIGKYIHQKCNYNSFRMNCIITCGLRHLYLRSQHMFLVHECVTCDLYQTE